MANRPVSFCWQCGARLPAMRCPVCTEAAHLDYLLREIDQWERDGRLNSAAIGHFREVYQHRLARVLGASFAPSPSPASPAAGPKPPVFAPPPPAAPPPVQAPPVAPPPAAPPPSAEPPGVTEPAAFQPEWDQLRRLTSVSRLYLLGVVFVVAGLAWLVIKAGGTWTVPWLLGGLAGGALWGGWRLHLGGHLRYGARALLAIGALLVPGALFALNASLRLLPGEIAAPAIWAVSAAVSFLLARRGRFASQLGLANLFAGLFALRLAAAVGGEAVATAAWAGVFCSPLAAVNVLFAARLRHLEPDETVAALRRTARASAIAFVVVAALGLLGTDPTEPAAAAVLGALLLGGALVALAHETRRPELVAVAALAWAACGWFADQLWPWPMGATIAALGLAAGAAVSRRRDPAFGPWYLGSAAALAVLTLGPHLPGLLDGVPAAAVASAWLLTACALLMALAWRDRLILPAVVVLGTIGTVYSASWLGAGPRWYAGWLTVATAATLAAAYSARRTTWDEQPVLPWLAWSTLVPLVAGLAVGLALMVDVGPEPVVTAALELLGLAAIAISLLTAESAVLYVSAVGLLGAWAGLVHDLPGLGEPFVAAPLAALLLLLPPLLGSRHWQPFEVVSLLLAAGCAVAACAVTLIDAPEPRGVVSLLLSALALAAPELGPLRRRSQLPELVEVEVRPWLATLTFALAAAGSSALYGVGLLPGAALVALVAVVGGLRLPLATGWHRPLVGAGLVIAVVAGFAGVDEPARPASLLGLLVCQLALLAACREQTSLPPLAAAQWLLVTGVWTFGPDHRAGHAGLFDGALHLLVAGLHFLRWRRAELAAVTGLVIGALAHYQFGQALAGEHLLLWCGLYLLVATGLALWLERQGATQAALGCYTIAAVCGAVAPAGAAALAQVHDALVLLALDTVVSLGLALTGRAPAPLPVVCANVLALYASATHWPPDSAAVYGFRCTWLAFANVAVAAAVRSRTTWRDGLLGTALAVGLIALACLLPPQRLTVFGLLVLAATSFTAAWVAGQVVLNDVGFGAAWVAMAMALVDAWQHGRGELAPYRSLDLYVAPLVVWLLAVVQRRLENPRPVRQAAALMLLGSLLIAAFASEIVPHDAALFIAIFAAVWYGSDQDDAVIRWAGVGCFALWALVQVWRLRSSLGQLLLIGLLIVLGVAAIVVALRREHESGD